MKKVTIIIIIVLIVSTITGCRLYDGEHWELYRMVRLNVLATNGVGETDKVDIEVIEEDEYGRILFSYSMNISYVYTGYESIRIIAICQESDRRRTYYYEDQCFIISDSYENISQEDIDNLKADNDWGEPLNEDEYSSRPIKPKYSDFYRMGARDIFISEIDVEDTLEVSCGFTDYDGISKILFYIVTNEYIESDGDYTHKQNFYVMIINEDGTYNKDEFLVEIDDLYNYQKQLHEFKISNGWSFS